LKYGCVGAGGIADWKHLAGYSKIKDIEITSICDSNLQAAQRLADKYRIPRVYNDYKEMLQKEELDLISVCTPNFLHAPVTLMALEKGINVHCEKPIALNAQEAAAMVEAKNKSGKKLMVALNNRFTNESVFVKHYIDSGALGPIYHAKCGWRRRKGIPGKGGWFTQKAFSGGGPLIDLGVHFMDLVMYFMGYPEVETVSGSTYDRFMHPDGEKVPGCDVEDMATGIVRLKNGCTIDFEFNWASHVEKEYNYYEILGEKGGISYRDGELKIYTDIAGTSINMVPEIDKYNKKLDEFEHFLDCIRNNKEPLAAPEEAAKLMAVIDAIYKSSATKREVVL
ncbi:MAG: Gfo/Idh/MocA family oxidoreductase, partial [Clostridia bacterium]|nr:Gfo/Idh/MocA family oxidoreductase [Clostridia bacterium]